MLVVVLAVTIFLYILRIFWHIPPARFGVHVQSMVRFNTYIGLALVTSLFKSEGMAILAILLALCIPLVNVISVLALTSKEHMAIKPVLIALLKTVDCIMWLGRSQCASYSYLGRLYSVY